MTRQQIFSIAFFSLLVLLLYQIGLMFKPFVFSALWAGLLAHWAFPLHIRLTKLFGGRDALSAGMLTVGALGMVVVPLVAMGMMLVREASAAEQEIRLWISAGRTPTSAGSSGGGSLHRWLVEVGGVRYQCACAFLGAIIHDRGEGTQPISRRRNRRPTEEHFRARDEFLHYVVGVVFSLYGWPAWLAVLYDLIPMEESHKSKILTRLDQTIRAVVKGMLVTAIVQGLLAGMAYLALDVPFPMGLTALTIVLAPIPFGGTGLVWGPVVFYLFWMGATGKALAMLVWGIGVISMVDQFLRPWLIGQDAQIPVLLLVLSVLGGLALYGLLGLFVGPILISLLMTAVQIYREEYHLQPLVALQARPLLRNLLVTLHSV